MGPAGKRNQIHQSEEPQEDDKQKLNQISFQTSYHQPLKIVLVHTQHRHLFGWLDERMDSFELKFLASLTRLFCTLGHL